VAVVLRPGLTIVRITRNRLFGTKKFVWENLRKFKRNCLRWVYTTVMMDEKLQSTISTIWLVNRILATIIISFLPCFSIWQFSVVCISCKTHSMTIYYVFHPRREDNSRKSSHNFVWFSWSRGHAFTEKQYIQQLQCNARIVYSYKYSALQLYIILYIIYYIIDYIILYYIILYT